MQLRGLEALAALVRGRARFVTSVTAGTFLVNDGSYAKQFKKFWGVFCYLVTVPLPVRVDLPVLESDVVYVLRNPSATIRCRFKSQRVCQEMPNLVP